MSVSAKTVSSKPVVWHISADFPDPISPNKTPVIRELTALTQQYAQHFVISINRENPGLASAVRGAIWPDASRLVSSYEQIEHGIALTYSAPGKGLLHRTMLLQLADKLTEMLQGQKKPDLIIGHKLTIEGIIAERMAERLDVPFAVSIQGDTDTKVMAARPELTSRFGHIFHRAQTVYPFSPWALKAIEKQVGKRAGQTILLPCPTDLDETLTPHVPGNGFVTAFHLRNYRRKNFKTLVTAMRLLEGELPDAKVDVVGGGSKRHVDACERIAAGSRNVRFCGPQERAALQDRFNSAVGFVLPSLRESFGLVFVEALFAGIPIIYPKGQSVDGFFDDLPFAIAVDARSARSIADGIVFVLENEQKLKTELIDWQNSDDAQRFKRPAIAAQFARGFKLASTSR